MEQFRVEDSTSALSRVRGREAKYQVDLSDDGIKHASYTARLYLWGIAKYGGAKCADALKNMFATIALVATFEAAFVNNDLNSTLAVSNDRLVEAFGICGGVSQILAIASVIMSVLMYIQLGFYDADEVAWFAFQFGTLTAFPVMCLITSLLLAIIAINIRAYLTYGSTTWYVVLAVSIACGTPCLCSYPWMDPKLRALREAHANALPTA